MMFTETQCAPIRGMKNPAPPGMSEEAGSGANEGYWAGCSIFW